MLAPLLTSMLNAFFLGGSIPACISSGLVPHAIYGGVDTKPAVVGVCSPVAPLVTYST